ncbi:WD40/YVTN/BNR-like repeat-containing protein [Flagellimonas meridianipacifica]|uniref:Photosystem II stability/assembly factor-like uncharacterized protein n=1 Tax=Flagellimonas meridianipacifica TaxID=1080225 RepID=A0A2T0MBS3_9FLAO|nr:hypothetical protein [Allomuricauda pacifica]PRX54882.1 photosystem II stability/assembly factor-like uncharacterized protein [Allomuricauda pacifica]
MKLSVLLSLVGVLLFTTPMFSQENKYADALKSYEWRAIGPANMGGRVTDIDGIPGDASTFYVSGADGGIFKTTNGGVDFTPIFEGQRAYSIGALTIAPSDHNVLWVGTGEGDPRNSVGYGWGVYRSVDAGKSWTHLGLKETERIKRIVVDPNDPDIACVCALGKEWGANPERGVFKTTDGGKSWDKILYIDEDTGCADIAMDMSNPRIMYAGMWTFRRRPWRFDDGGKETAIYRTMDGGKTWKKIMNGLPETPMARPGIHIAQSQPNIVYLMTEFQGGGTAFRSEDRGDNWVMVNDDPNINFRPFYYSDVRVDPNNPDILFSISGRLSRSVDGGKTWERIATTVHGDHQSLWIDPANSNRILNGSDGGYQISHDGGDSWEIINNVELSQFYQIFIDNKDPYNIYGGLQDNGTWVGPSNSLYSAGILKRHWKGLAYGDGYYAVPIPGSEHEVYANLQGGVIFHVDSRHGNVRNIHPYPKIIGSAGDAIEDHKYRFNWDAPILISPHDTNTVYTGGNVVFKSTDRGHSWEEISGDLTTNDKSKQKTSGGEIYQDNTAAEFHCTILYIDESPVEAGVIWVGTDDGNVQLTRDGGVTWTKLNDRIKGLPDFAWVSKIHASEHDAGTAFVTVDQHRMDDFRPYAFMTTDYGRTWSKISNGLPQDDYVKVVRQDPINPNLLYVGMEHGIFASWDKGQSWTKINNNLPNVSVRDLRIQPRDRDLIVGTHGRGAWVLDDIRPLQEMADTNGKSTHLFPVRRATQWHMFWRIENLGDRHYKAKNPDYGANINFYLADGEKKTATVEIVDVSGEVIRTLKDSTAKKGINRIVWDLGHEAATKMENDQGGGFFSGPMYPLASPGTYTARLKVNGEVLETPIEVRSDPRMDLTPQDYESKTKVLLELRGLLSTTNTMINTTNTYKTQLVELKNKLEHSQGSGMDKSLLEDIKSAMGNISDLQDDILKRPPPSMTYRQRPRLREEIRSLMRAVNSAFAKPTQPQISRLEQLKGEVNEATGKLNAIVNTNIKGINDKTANIPQISVGE